MAFEEKCIGLKRILPAAVFISALVIAGPPAGTTGQNRPFGGKGAPEDFEKILYTKVLVLNYDPVIESHGGKRLHEVLGWNHPGALALGCAADLEACSNGGVRPQLAGWQDIDAFPVKVDGFSYTDQEYLNCWYSGTGWHWPDGVDYHKVISDWNLTSLVDGGAVDEVWLFGGPYFGYYESVMAGPGAYWCNAPPLPGVNCSKIFVIMGFNYERGIDCMLEDFGHRTESIMTHVFGSWNGYPPMHDWDRFTLYDKIAPGEAACGNIHFAPNSEKDYDWGNTACVWSTCGDWLDYPDLTGAKILVNCQEWGGGDMRLHHLWWFLHLPHAPGRSSGTLNNWWRYVFDYNAYDESS